MSEKKPRKKEWQSHEKIKKYPSATADRKSPEKKEKTPQKTQQKNHQNHPKNIVPKTLKINRIGQKWGKTKK